MRISLDDVRMVGRDLVGCEGVACAPDGTIWVADGAGACTRMGASTARSVRGGMPAVTGVRRAGS